MSNFNPNATRGPEDEAAFRAIAAQALKESIADGLLTIDDLASMNQWVAERKRKRAEVEAADIAASTPPADHTADLSRI